MALGASGTGLERVDPVGGFDWLLLFVSFSSCGHGVGLMRVSEECASRLVFKPLALLLRRRSVEIKSSSSAVSYTIPDLEIAAVDMAASLFSDFRAPDACVAGVVVVFEKSPLFAVGVIVFESMGVTVSGNGAVDGDRSEDSEAVG